MRASFETRSFVHVEANDHDLVARFQIRIVVAQAGQDVRGAVEAVFSGLVVGDAVDGLGDGGGDAAGQADFVVGLEHQQRRSDLYRVIETHGHAFASVADGGKVRGPEPQALYSLVLPLV